MSAVGLRLVRVGGCSIEFPIEEFGESLQSLRSTSMERGLSFIYGDERS